MATTYKSIEDEVRKGLSGSYNNSVNTLKQNAAANKQTINAGADASAKTIKDYYATEEADTREANEDKLQSNEVQRVLNERYIARKAAEMGLTDSGLNRTQQTAVQLSYANQKGDLEQQRQKAVETLAAAMQAKLTEVETKRNADLTSIDTTLNTNLANLKRSFENDVITNANARWNTYLEDLRKQEEANQKEQERLATTKEKQKTAYNSFVKDLMSADYTDSQKAQMIKDYIKEKGNVTESEINALCAYSGLEKSDLGFSSSVKIPQNFFAKYNPLTIK